MSSVLVVVIVGVIIVAIAASAVGGVGKPATRPDPPDREAAIEWGMPEPALEDEGWEPEAELAPAEQGVVARLRAAGLLAVAVVVLGATAAAVLGIAALLGARAVDGALG